MALHLYSSRKNKLVWAEDGADQNLLKKKNKNNKHPHCLTHREKWKHEGVL